VLGKKKEDRGLQTRIRLTGEGPPSYHYGTSPWRKHDKAGNIRGTKNPSKKGTTGIQGHPAGEMGWAKKFGTTRRDLEKTETELSKAHG